MPTIHTSIEAPKLVSASEAARRIGVAPQTIIRLIESGRIKAIDCGTKTRRFFKIHVDEVSRFMAEQDESENEDQEV